MPSMTLRRAGSLEKTSGQEGKSINLARVAVLNCIAIVLTLNCRSGWFPVQYADRIWPTPEPV